MAHLEVRLFGPPQILQHGNAIHIDRRKALALFAFLAVTGKPHSRETLSALLWPEETTELAHADLRRILSLLRRLLGAESLESDRETICISSKAEIDLDIARFRSHLQRWHAHSHPTDEVCQDCLKSVSEAVLVHLDPFMSGFSLPDAPEFDAWLRLQSQTLQDELADALDWLAEQYARLGQWEQAIPCARQRVALDPLDEPAQVQLMQYYARAGQGSALRRQFKECERVLREELGVAPQAETQRAYRALLEQQKSPLPEKPPARKDASFKTPFKHNLPVQGFPFIGRENLLLDLDHYLEDPLVRLLTLIGPGGSGKTRLALEAGERHLSVFPQGVFVIWLAPVTSAELVIPTIAQTLGLSFSADSRGKVPDQAVQKRQLLDYLHGKNLLLILDGCEHLLSAVGLFSEILQAAPQLKILATSRARLGLVEEQLFPVSGMSLPYWGAARAGVGSLEEASAYGAIRLFVAGARRTQPEFSLNERNLAAVLRICRAVEGLPLGILLAASWLRMLSPQEIAVNIDQDYTFLETGLGELPEGQRSMRAVFTRSWKLLSTREQEVFQGLSVFQGGFTAQAAHSVTGASLQELARLFDQSLIQREMEGRYTLHDLLKQFAAEHLREDPARENDVHSHHCAYYTEFLEHRQVHLQDHDQQAILADILPEIGNVRAGWDWAREQEDSQYIEKIAELHLGVGDLARQMYDTEIAADAYQRVMKLYSEHGKFDQAARAAMKLGLVYQIANDPRQARQAYEQGFGFWQQANQAAMSEHNPPAPHALRVALWGGPLRISQDIATLENSSLVDVLVQQFFSGLVQTSPELEVLPDVARTWEISDGGRKYIFHLRKDVLWSDGIPVTARDFEFAWKRTLAPETRSEVASLFFDIRGAQAYHQGELNDTSLVGIHAVDDYTLMLDLEEPACYFLQILTHPIAKPVPYHVVSVQGYDWKNLERIVTNGPFRLQGTPSDVPLKLTRNPTYHGNFTGNLQDVEVFFFDWAAQLAAYEHDQLDSVTYVPYSQINQIRQKYAGEYFSSLDLGTRCIFFDTTRPPFNDVRVRQALSMSMNREKLAEQILEGADFPATGGFVPPGVPGHTEGVALPYDPEKARRLLAQAGYPGGKGFPKVIAFTTDVLEGIGTYLKNQWQSELGIDIPYQETVDGIFLFNSRNDRERIPHIRMFGWLADYPDPDSVLRIPFYVLWKELPDMTPAYFDLVERARRTRAQEERMRMYVQAEKMLAEEAVIVPLSYARRHLLLKPWVRRFPTSPINIGIWKDAIIDPH